MPTKLRDPEHWRSRAEEARVHAEQMSDPAGRLTMLEIADHYEHLARRAVMRLTYQKRPTAPETAVRATLPACPTSSSTLGPSAPNGATSTAMPDGLAGSIGRKPELLG